MRSTLLNKTLLWLDDIRNPSEFEHRWVFGWGIPTIYWVRNHKEFTDWITANGLPDGVNFDHDLGDFNADEESTGMDCAKWLVDYCLDNDLDLPMYAVHSDNTVGAENILKLLINYEKHRSNQVN